MGNSSNSGELLRAVRLDPSNPKLHYQLGLAYCYSLQDSHPKEGLSELRKATKLDSSQPTYWSALASACESIDDIACSDRATDRTLALAPMTPRYRWDAANRDLAAGDSTAALAQFRQLLELDPSYAPQSFRLCLRLGVDPWSVYRKVLAGRENPRLNFAYINYLWANGQGAKAYPVWRATLALHQHFRFALAEPYFEWLLRNAPEQRAVEAWHDLEQDGIIRKSSADTSGNLMFNGSFEGSLMNVGFGWHVQEASYTRVRLDDSVAFRGRRSLRVEFTVSHNGDDLPVYEIVPVKPNRTYLLHAYARSEAITSDSGPRLRVVDPDCSSCLNVSSAETVGTTQWHRLNVSFSTGPQTRLVEVEVWRPRGATYPDQISGTFWLDAVRLEETASASHQVAQKVSPPKP